VRALTIIGKPADTYSVPECDFCGDTGPSRRIVVTTNDRGDQEIGAVLCALCRRDYLDGLAQSD
jgi:hypothetical protein